MPIKKVSAAEKSEDVPHTEVGQAPELPTEVVPTPPTDAGPTAWAEVPDDDIEEPPKLDDRRPLSVALIALLAGVVIGGIGLGAYVIGEHVNRVYVRPARSSAQTPGIGGLPTNPPTAAPTTTVTPTPAIHFPPNAWEAFTYLLRSRGLSIDPAEKDYDDKANRHLCWALFSNDDPAFREKMIQGSIEQSEGGSWGEPEARYAIHSAVMAYCPQYDKPGWFK